MLEKILYALAIPLIVMFSAIKWALPNAAMYAGGYCIPALILAYFDPDLAIAIMITAIGHGAVLGISPRRRLAETQRTTWELNHPNIIPVLSLSLIIITSFAVFLQSGIYNMLVSFGLFCVCNFLFRVFMEKLAG